MILLERAHKNIQAVLTNAWLEDDAYTTLVDRIVALPPRAVQFVGACIDDDALPIPMPDQEGAGLSVAELMDLITYNTGVQPLTREAMEAFLVSKASLMDPALQKRVLLTAYEMLVTEESGLAQTLLYKLQDFSEGTLSFDDEITTTLYRKVYLLLLFRYAHTLPEGMFLGMFSSTLFTLAIYMEIRIVPALEAQIQSFNMISNRRQYSLDYAAALRSNTAPFGVNAAGKEMTVAAWIEYWAKTLDAVPNESFFDTLEQDDALLANDESLQPLIEMIAYIYRLLVTGYFIVESAAKKTVDKIAQEIQKEEQQALLEKKAVPFPDDLAAHATTAATWLGQTATLQSLLVWLATFASKQEGRAQLKQLLERVLPQIGENMEIASALIQIDGFLKQNGFVGDDLLFFDEEHGIFRYS